MLKYMRMNKKLKETTLRFIELNGFEELTNVQEEVLKYAGSGKDVIALSKTGTGKTHAYLIPIMEMINPVSNRPRSSSRCRPENWLTRSIKTALS